MSEFLGTDRRVLVLALARMADALGNSFLIVVLPLFIGSGRVPLDPFVGPVTFAAPNPLGGRPAWTFGFEMTTPLLIGIALSLFGFLNSFSQPFTGRLSDRTGKRRAYILFGLALLAAASGAYAFVNDYRLVLVLRALQGLGAAFTIPPTVALVNELADATARGGNFGVFNTFRLIGFGFGPIVAGGVVQSFGFDAAFAVAVVGALVSFGLVSLFVSDPERTDATAGEDLSVDVFDSGDSVLDPVFTLGVATVLMALGIALFATLEPEINARLGQGELLFGVEFGAVVVANVVFQVPVGRASDRYGRRPFLLAGFLLLAPTTLVQGYVTTPLWMVVARLLQGTAVALVFAPSLALAGDLAREGSSGTTLSILTMGFGLGTALGPLVSGALVRFGFAVPFAVGAALALVALALVYSQVDETVPAGEPDAAPAVQD